MDWMSHIPDVPLTWLLERENPSVRARTLTELLDRNGEDPEVVESRQAIADAPDTQRILADQRPEGHWGRPEHYFRKHTGMALAHAARARLRTDAPADAEGRRVPARYRP